VGRVAVGSGVALRVDRHRHRPAQLSEGLAIGQAGASGEISLAVVLIVGFGLHNATEGFGIVAPLSGEPVRPSWRFLLLLGLIGAARRSSAPDRAGVGQRGPLDPVPRAGGGSILYVVLELVNVNRRMASKQFIAWFVLLGLFLGFATEFVVEPPGSRPVLPTFVIGLREGVEAALIVGIIAAFLRQEGRRDALRWMWVGVAIAAAICVTAGVTLELVSRDLPQRQQEMLETVVGAIAVAAVTFMIVWMRRNARGLRRALEGRASDALAEGSVIALVAMAFFAVIREGFETSVFLLAAFDSSSDPLAAGGGRSSASCSPSGSATGSTAAASGSTWPGSSGSPGSSWCWSRRPRRDRPAHRARGRLAQQPAGPDRRPGWLSRPAPCARHPDRPARLPAAPGDRRGDRLPRLRNPGGDLRPLAVGLRLRRHRAAQPLSAGRTA
jgi:hypothetical protein